MKFFEYNCLKPSTPVSPEISSPTSFASIPAFSKSPQPFQRSYHAVCVHRNKIYLYGGRGFKGTLNDFWVYSIESKTWKRVICEGDLPPSLEGHTMEVFDDNIYIFGGETSFANAEESPLWKFDLSISTWTKIPKKEKVMSPTGRRHHTSVLYMDTMCIYGGYQDLIGASKDLWLFDFETSSWHFDVGASSESAPDPRYGHCAVVNGHSMWVCGGLTGLKPNSDVHVWDFELRVWIPVRTKGGPAELSGHAMCLFGNLMYVFGGCTSASGDVSNDLWCLSMVDQTWKKCHFNSDIKPPAVTGHCVLSRLVPKPSVKKDQRSSSFPDMKTRSGSRASRERIPAQFASSRSLPNDSRSTKVKSNSTNQFLVESDKMNLIRKDTTDQQLFAYDNPVSLANENDSGNARFHLPSNIPPVSGSVDHVVVRRNQVRLPGGRNGLQRPPRASFFSYNLTRETFPDMEEGCEETSFIEIPNYFSEVSNVINKVKTVNPSQSPAVTRITVQPCRSPSIEDEITQPCQNFDDDFCESVGSREMNNMTGKEGSAHPQCVGDTLNHNPIVPANTIFILGGRTTDSSPLTSKPLCMWECRQL